MPKSSEPPVLPEVKFDRVVRVARGDAAGVMACAGVSLLLSLLAGDVAFSAFAALALGCGYMEWHGQDQLRHGEFEGTQWLVGAQLCLYTVILGYVAWRWKFFNPGAVWAQIPVTMRSIIEEQMQQLGYDPATQRDAYLRLMEQVVCVVFLAVSTLYQLGLAFWYQLQRRAVWECLAAENPSTHESAED